MTHLSPIPLIRPPPSPSSRTPVALIASPASSSLPGGSAEEQACLNVYATTLQQASGWAGEVVDPLRGLIHADVTLADEVWVLTLKAAWAAFPDRRRAEFSGTAGALLAKPWHAKTMNLPPLMQGSHSVSFCGALRCFT